MSDEGTPSAVSPGELIRGNNATWTMLYYDELVDTEDYQLSLVEDAGVDGFYNCAHAVSRADASALDAIESFYTEHNLPPAIYLDPEAPPMLQRVLQDRGYSEVAEEAEHWYTIDLVNGCDFSRTPRSWLHIDPERVEIVTVSSGDVDFGEFLDVDIVSNELPAPLEERLRRYSCERQHPIAYNIFLLARVDGRPAATSSVGVCGANAYFSEGGTVPEYRRMGLYSALLQRRLEVAVEHGCSVAARTCSPTAYSGPASARLGFKHVWSRIYMRKDQR